MRASRRLHRRCVAFRHHAGASVVILSLLALFLSQPFHAISPIEAPRSIQAAATGAVISNERPVHASAHDADFCSVCRATAQTRLGLRVALRLGEVAAYGPSLPLQLPAQTLARAAPQLREAQPRAPPSTLLLLQA